MTRFEEFLRRVEAEAEAEGPEAVAELDALRDHYRLARELARRRQSLGWTQHHLSQLSGIPQSEISRIERGRANPTLMTVSRLSSALGVRLCMHEGHREDQGWGAEPAPEPITDADRRGGGGGACARAARPRAAGA